MEGEGGEGVSKDSTSLPAIWHNKPQSTKLDEDRDKWVEEEAKHSEYNWIVLLTSFSSSFTLLCYGIE